MTARQTAPGDYQGHPTLEIHRVSLVVISHSDSWQLVGAYHSFMAARHPVSDPEVPHRQPSGLVDAKRGARDDA